MRKGRPLKEVWSDFRMILALWLVGRIMHVAPNDPDGNDLIETLISWMERCKARQGVGK